MWCLHSVYSVPRCDANGDDMPHLDATVRVLIVDDQHPSAARRAVWSSSPGFVVWVSGNWRGALDTARALRPDLC